MARFVVIFSLLSLLFEAGLSAHLGKRDRCVCYQMYLPVCGSLDGELVEFGNECFAQCAGATDIREGSCVGANQLPVFPEVPVQLPVLPGEKAAEKKIEKNKRETGCACLFNYDPVCGTDGQDYSNACMARCSGTDVAHAGSCMPTEVHEHIPDFPSQLPVFPSNRKVDSDVEFVDTDQPFRGREKDQEIPFPPCLCANEYDPVCATNGITYVSSCVAYCDEATVAHEGPCAPSIEQPMVNPDNMKANKKRSSEPCACTLEYSPVCDTTGVTHTSVCVAQCNGVIIAHKGFCAPTIELPMVIPDKMKEKKKRSSDPCICTFEYAPVCDTNGLTHSSACFAQCSGATVEHAGECAPSIVLPIAPDSGVKRSEKVHKRACACSYEYRPVCGNNGVSYSSPCVAQCNGAGVRHEGFCGPEDVHIEQPIAPELPIDSLCDCTMEYNPVCGTDGQHYANPCLAACSGVDVVPESMCGLHLTVAVEGHTPGELKEIKKKNQLAGDKSKRTARCVCTTDYNPVCGTDGHTYPNHCAAECASIHVDVLNGYVNGACESRCRCTREYKPVCTRQHMKFLNRCVAIQCMGENEADLRECN